jgi:molecular chaperone GrpE
LTFGIDYDQIKYSERAIKEILKGASMTKKKDADQPVEQPVNEADESVVQPSATQPSREEELTAQVQRLMAEFDNYRRRTEEERKQMVQMAQAHTLLELTPVLDNFRRATDHLPEDLKGNNWVTGVLYVEKQLDQILEQFGLQKIETVGKAFDPKLHEAISTEASDQPADTIIAEIEGGYLLNGLVLKPARVKVSSGPAQ